MNETPQNEKKSKRVISLENAERQFRVLEEYYDLDEDDMIDDLDESSEDATGDEIDEAGKAGYRMARKRLLRAIMCGLLEIKEDGNTLRVVQKLRKPPADLGGAEIVYNEITGQSKIPMSKHKDTNIYGKIYAFLSGLSGHPEAIFRNMRGADLSIAESLGAVFLRV